MARAVNRLNAIKVKNLKKLGYHPDGGGLYLKVTPSGSKSWIFRYALGGRERHLGLGATTDVELATARELAATARAKQRQGIDPIDDRREEEAQTRRDTARALTFKQVAEDYITNNEPIWKNPKHRQQWRNTLETYVYPIVGNLAVGQVTTEHVLKILKPIWTTKPETSSRIRGRIEIILNAAKTLGAREGENPATWRGHLSNLLPKQSKTARVKHHAAMTYADVPDFIAELTEHDGFAVLAFRLLILTACRTNEVLGARWSEIDMDAGVWTIPGERMKAGREHRVPLSPATLDVLREAEKVKLNEFVFPGQKRGKPLSKLMLLRRFNVAHVTAHGFRSSFRDWASETTAHPSEVVEMALAHTIENKVEAAYWRMDLLDKRLKLMNDWATTARCLRRRRSSSSKIGGRNSRVAPVSAMCGRVIQSGAPLLPVLETGR